MTIADLRFQITDSLEGPALLLVGAGLLAQVAKPSGAATPQEAVAVINKATAANDFLLALPVISPSGLKVIANEGVTGVLMVLAFSDPDDAMPGSAKPAKAELDAQRKKYKDAVDLAKVILKPHGHGRRVRLVRSRVYRIDAFLRLIELDAWGLELPLVVRSSEISQTTLSGTPPGAYDGPHPGTREISLPKPSALARRTRDRRGRSPAGAGARSRGLRLPISDFRLPIPNELPGFGQLRAAR